MLFVALSLSGCYHTYLISRTDWVPGLPGSHVGVAAIRESDGEHLILDPKSLRTDTVSQPAPPPGMVRVRSARARSLWISAPILTSAGAVLAITGAALAIPNISLDVDAIPLTSTQRTRQNLGFGLISVGSILAATGTILFGVAAAKETDARDISR